MLYVVVPIAPRNPTKGFQFLLPQNNDIFKNFILIGGDMNSAFYGIKTQYTSSYRAVHPKCTEALSGKTQAENLGKDG